MNINEIISLLEEKFPIKNAFEWDNIGLIFNALNENIEKVLICLDITKSVINEAILKNVNLIITHHPIFLSSKDTKYNPTTNQILNLLSDNNISVYCLHTNYDVCKNGMNDFLAEKICLNNIETLNNKSKLGRVGYINEQNIEDVIINVKSRLYLSNVRYIGNQSIKVKKIAIIAGSGSSEYLSLLEQNIDLFITGDVTYHTAINMKECNLNCLDIGHFVENLYKIEVKKLLNEYFLNLEVIMANYEKDPFIYK